MPLVFRSVSELQKWRQTQSAKIGFVPTMGALHQGHAELLRRCRNENDLSVLSIFVNPTQFNDPKDFEKYPITWEADLALAEELKVDVVFAPTASEMYPDGYRYQILENQFSKILCGKDRPGHFDGVLSVVMKLFQLVQPTKAYFGEKDYQQLKLIQGMVTSYFLNLEIVPVPTLRESDGLAMSSRNMRLSASERAKAPLIYQAIKNSKTAAEAFQNLEKNLFRVDYVEDIDGRRFVAARLGEVRLIDNIKI